MKTSATVCKGRRERERERERCTMAPPSSQYVFLILFLLMFLSVDQVTSSPTTVRLPLRQITSPRAPNAASHPAPFEKLARLAAASLLRARHLKDPKRDSGSSALPIPFSRTPLFPHSYGGYSISLGFGTPPQRIPLVLDTGSDLVWVPCTKSYLCNNCSFPSPGNPDSNATAVVPVFFPKSSSSARLVGCRNPKCTWIHSPEFLSRCRDCPLNASAAGCSPVCPPYMIVYGSGSTGGLLLSEALRLSPEAEGAAVSDFVVGCSVFSSRQPAAGIAGFGRGPASLPSQLGLGRFSYCFISRRYDDEAGESGSAVLGGAPESSSGGLSFTPFLQNPSSGSPFSVYYYLGLRRITVDGKKVKIPHAALMPLPGGDGGTIVDSGTTFTYMEPGVFEAVARAVEGGVAGRYNRSAPAEQLTGLRPCFSLAAAREEGVRLPELAFHFKGGAKMRLPLANYFAFAGGSRAVCLTMVTDAGPVDGAGPTIILGSFQQQNYYVLYDLERKRLGFRQQSCLDQ
uniref:Aspartic proteinase nepenthesin-2 n=1 Tax=Anthurium amnicola TaxID=1678845 RepID=A0A1D1Z1H5_9ARAE